MHNYVFYTTDLSKDNRVYKAHKLSRKNLIVDKVLHHFIVTKHLVTQQLLVTLFSVTCFLRKPRIVTSSHALETSDQEFRFFIAVIVKSSCEWRLVGD